MEIDQIRQSLYNNTEQKLASARQSWVLEKDAEIASKIKTGVSMNVIKSQPSMWMRFIVCLLLL